MNFAKDEWGQSESLVAELAEDHLALCRISALSSESLHTYALSPGSRFVVKHPIHTIEIARHNMADLEEQKQTQDAERDIVKLWRAWRTVHEMCKDRVCAAT